MTGSEIRAYRDRMRFTQTQLGEALSVARNTIARWERGDLQPENPAMLRLALDHLEQQAVLNLRGKAGREVQKRLKMLQQINVELKELIAQNSE